MAGCSFADEADAEPGAGAGGALPATTGAACGDAAIQAAEVSLTYAGAPEDFYARDGLRVTLSATPCELPEGVRFETGLLVPEGVEVVATVTTSEGGAARDPRAVNVTSVVRAKAPGEYVLTGVAALVDASGAGVLQSYALLGLRGGDDAATTFQPPRPLSGSLLGHASEHDAERAARDGRGNGSEDADANGTLLPLRLVAMGDTGVGPNASANVQGSVEDGAEGFIGLGDYYYWHPVEEWFDVFAPLLEAQAHLAIGNHDSATTMSPWLDEGTNWSRRVGGARVVALDTNQDLWSSGSQYRWAWTELCGAEEPLRIVVAHAPWWLGEDAFHPVGEFDGSPAAMDELVDDCGVDLVLAAHEHNYQRYARGDAQYLVVGTGGEGLYPVRGAPPGTVAAYAEHGRLVLDIRPDGYEASFKTIDGETLDRFEGAASS